MPRYLAGPGWHHDHENPGTWRYWDGTDWEGEPVQAIPDGQTEAPLITPAWLMKSISAHGATPGLLTLDRDRLRFTAGVDAQPMSGPAVFEVALPEISDVKWPRYNTGTVVRFKAAGKKYRLSFMPPTGKWEWAGWGLIDIPQARAFGRDWQRALAGS